MSDDVEVFTQKQIYSQLIIASIQTALSFLLEYMPNTILIFLLQHTNNQTLVGSFGLGILSTQAFGQGILNGLACGLETLVSQAFGANKFQLCGKLYYRSIFVSTLLMIPISIYLLCSYYLLQLLNDNEELIEQTYNFNRYMILAVYLDAIFVDTKVFLNGQNIYNFQFYTQAISIILFGGVSYLFIIIYQWGMIGCALSLTFMYTINNILLFLFIYFNKDCRRRFLSFKLKYLKHSLEFFKAAVPIGAILWLEWVSFEFYVMLASFLSIEIISSHVMMSNFSGFLYQFSYGISIVSTTYVGNEMGRNNIILAKRYSIASTIIELVFLLVSQSLIYIFGDELISLFTNNDLVAEQLDNCLTLMIIFIILDGIQALVSGLVRAIGKENSATLGFVLCYLIVGEIIAYCLCYQLDMSLEGIWLGIIAGAVLYDGIQIFSLLWNKWDDQANLISSKMEALAPNQIDNAIL